MIRPAAVLLLALAAGAGWQTAAPPVPFKVIGYYADWTASRYPLAQIPADRLTHVNYAFGKIGSDNRLTWNAAAAIEQVYPGDCTDPGCPHGLFNQIPQSMRLKGECIAGQGLAGAMFWELSNDNGQLLEALRAVSGARVQGRERVHLPICRRAARQAKNRFIVVRATPSMRRWPTRAMAPPTSAVASTCTAVPLATGSRAIVAAPLTKPVRPVPCIARR